MKRLAVFLGTLGILLGVGVNAAAATPVLSTTEMATSVLPTDYVWRTMAQLPSVTLEAGKQYRVWGQFTGTANAGALQQTRIHCGSTVAPSSSTNNLSVSTTIATEWIFTPSASGEHTCQLRGYSAKCAILVKGGPCVPQTQYRLNVSSVRLSIDLAPQSGAYWRQSGDVRFGNGSTGRPKAVDVLWATNTLPAGTTAVQVHTGPEVSAESTGASTPLRVRVTHTVRQLYPNGSYCRVTKITDDKYISGTLHHYKFNKVQKVAVDPACGTLNFNVKVYFNWVSGHGGVVHGPAYSSAYILAA